MAGRATTARAGFAADFLDRCQAANGDRIGDSAFADFETMTNDCLGTIRGGVSMCKDLHKRVCFTRHQSDQKLKFEVKPSSFAESDCFENESQLHHYRGSPDTCQGA